MIHVLKIQNEKLQFLPSGSYSWGQGNVHENKNKYT